MTLTLLFSCMSAARANESIIVTINAEETEIEAIFSDGELYIPVRAFAESLSYGVQWNNDERCASVKIGETTVEIPEGEKW